MKSKRIFFKFIFIFLVAILFFACDGGGSSSRSSSPAVIDNDTGADEPTTVTPDEPGEDEKIMIAVFLYDGSLKSFNDDKSLSVICDAESIVKVDDQWIIDDKIYDEIGGEAVSSLPEIIIKACNYGGVMWLYGESKSIYRDGVNIATNTNGYAIAFNSDGVAYGFTFFKPDGSLIIADSSFGFLLSNKIVGVESYNSDKIKKVFNGSEWITISTSLYSDFFKYDALVTDSKVIWTTGSILDLETMNAIEPTYNTALEKFVGGNAFVNYFIKRTEQRWQPIGYINDTAYFFRPKNGKVYKYSISGDTLTEWIQIVTGSAVDDIATNNALIEQTGCILVESEIIYFDGYKINRIDVSTGEKNEIAESTEFKGIAI